MESPNSKYATFLENYDKGNTFLNNTVQSFLNQISFDVKKIIDSDDSMLKDKFTPLLKTIHDPSMSGYIKSLAIGNIIADSAKHIVHSDNKEIKNSGIDLINNFLNIAKETEDQQLINLSMRISENIDFDNIQI